MTKAKKTLLIILPILVAIIMAIGFSLPCNFEKGQTEKVNNFVEAETGASTAPVSDKGGAIFLEQNTKYTMSGGTLSGKSKKYGGAVFISSGATFTMTGGTITKNSATYGGGIYVQAGGTCRITGGSITGNTANYGPAIYVEYGATLELGSSVTIDKNQVCDDNKPYVIGEEELMGGTYKGVSSTLKFKTITFGNYPQTYVGNALNATLESWYSGKPIVNNYTTIGYEEYFSFDAYEYIDGNIYARGQSWGYYDDFTFKDGTSVPKDGTMMWFKVEPIKWYILNYDAWKAGKENMELLSQLVLASFVQFNPSEYTGGRHEWKGSELQTWCNENFYNPAFSDAEKKIIALTENKNCETGEYTKSPDTWTGETTNDYVYCKTYYEMTVDPFSATSKVGNSEAARVCSPSDMALSNHCSAEFSNNYTTAYRGKGTAAWRLRSAEDRTGRVWNVTNFGTFSNNSVTYLYYGVRPALHLNIKP